MGILTGYWWNVRELGMQMRSFGGNLRSLRGNFEVKSGEIGGDLWYFWSSFGGNFEEFPRNLGVIWSIFGELLRMYGRFGVTYR